MTVCSNRCGSSSVTPHYVVTPFEGIKNRAGKIKVETAPGCHIYKSLPAQAPETLSTADGQKGLQLKIFNGTEFAGEPVYSEVTPRVQHGWFDRSVPNADQESFSVLMEGFFTPQESGLHTLELHGVGWSKLYLDNNLLIDHSHDSDMGQALKKEVKLEGGRSHPIKVEYYWQGSPRWKSVGIGHPPPQPKDSIAEAVKLAKNSDAVVLVASLNPEWETEGADRVDINRSPNLTESNPI